MSRRCSAQTRTVVTSSTQKVNAERCPRVRASSVVRTQQGPATQRAARYALEMLIFSTQAPRSGTTLRQRTARRQRVPAPAGVRGRWWQRRVRMGQWCVPAAAAQTQQQTSRALSPNAKTPIACAAMLQASLSRCSQANVANARTAARQRSATGEGFKRRRAVAAGQVA